MGERVVGLEGQLKRWVVVSSDKEQWGQEGRIFFSVDSLIKPVHFRLNLEL